MNKLYGLKSAIRDNEQNGTRKNLKVPNLNQSWPKQTAEKGKSSQPLQNQTMQVNREVANTQGKPRKAVKQLPD